MGLFSRTPFDDDFSFGPTDAGSFARRERQKYMGRRINIDSTGSITSFTKRDDMNIKAENLNVTASRGAPTTISFATDAGAEIKVTLSTSAAEKLANALLPYAFFDKITNELQTSRNATVFYTNATPGGVTDSHNQAVIRKFGNGKAEKVSVLRGGNNYGERRIVEYLDSSLIKRSAYQAQTRELIIQFAGPGTKNSKVAYRYLEVPPSYAKGLEIAESAGKYYNDVIKGAYPSHGIDTFPTR